MKLSVRWLRELVDLEGLEADEIAHRLTFHTAAIEGIERLGEGLDGVVTARVEQVRPHPDADRLRLCTVDAGTEERPEVVCGAPNVAEGQIVCFARAGLTLPGGLRLERRRIRGVESAGMICAEDELGLGPDHEGILVLPDGTPPGRPVGEALGVADEILEVENTSITHRPDLWGHVGFAREVAALFGRELRLPGAERAEAALAAADGDPFPLEIEDPEGCRRYVGVVLEGPFDRPSPLPLRHRLESLGVRSLGLLVDLTNLVMLEQGQPLHAFDLRYLRGPRVLVRGARPGERLLTLDGVDRALGGEDLVIADAEGPVAVAGVMGGAESEVRPDTPAILLEAANFDPVRVRRTAQRLGLRTEASGRFEKSLDPATARTAALRMTDLLLAHCPGARVARPIADAYPRPQPEVRIALPQGLVGRRLGARVTLAEVRAHLVALGFGVAEGISTYLVDVPSWRAAKDVRGPEDLVEEVGRLRGYDRIEPLPPTGSFVPRRRPPIRRLERRLAARLSLDLGYAETKSRSFYGPGDCDRLGIGDLEHVRLAAAYTEEQDRLVLTTAPGLLRAASLNQVREPRGRMWESTRLFVPAAPGGARPEEVRVLGAVVWDREAGETGAGDLYLGVLEDLRTLLGEGSWFTTREAPGQALATGLPPPRWLHPGRTAAIEGGDRVLAVAGEVAPGVARAFGLSGRAALAEVALDALLEAGPERETPYRPLHRYPVVPFDVSVILPRRTPAARVLETIAAVDREAVRDVHVFDVYEGEGIPEGQRSLALRCTLLDREGTLTSARADRLRQKVRAALEREGWTVRAGDAGA